MPLRHDSITDPHPFQLRPKPQATTQPSTPEEVNNSPLLTISGDIRNQIYHHVFTHPSDVNGIHLFFGTGQSNSTTLNSATALSQTNKFFYSETKALLHHLNTFHLHIPLLQDDPQPFPSSAFSSSTLSSSPSSSLSEPSDPKSHIRKLSSEFCSALTSPPPSTISALSHLANVIPRFPTSLRSVVLHLGKQETKTFMLGFHSAWDAVVPLLRDLRDKLQGKEVRVEFGLRVSGRVHLDWGFGIGGGAEGMVEEIDGMLNRQMEGKGLRGQEGEILLTVGELGNVNEVRRRVVRGVWEGVAVGYWCG